MCFKKSYFGLLSDFCNWTVSYCLCISYFSSILLCNNLFIRDHISQNCDKVINSPMLLVIIQMICSVVSSTHWKLCRFVLEPSPMLLVIIQMICSVVGSTHWKLCQFVLEPRTLNTIDFPLYREGCLKYAGSVVISVLFLGKVQNPVHGKAHW